MKTGKRYWAAVTALSLFIGACGGGGDDTQSYAVGGTVSGLNGELTLSVGEETLTISENGEFVLANTVEDGSTLSVAVKSAPFTQECSLTSESSVTVDGADVDDITVACINVGSLSGTVSDYYTGAAVADATVTVTVSAEDGEEPMAVAEAHTDAAGHYGIDGIGVSARFVATVEADGYAARTGTFANSAENGEATFDALLVEAQLEQSFNPANATELTVNGLVVVSLPAGVLRTADGGMPSGEVQATITLIDPSSDPNIMPGGYQTSDPATGAVRQIESFGAVDVRFEDASGASLQLAEGSTATLRIPLAQAAENPPATVPLYYLDPASGYWVEEGGAELVQTEAGQAYVGAVSHFTTWNADQVYNTVNILGCVQDAEGQRLAGVTVSSYGQSYIGSASGISDATGAFSVPAQINSTVLVSGIYGAQSQTLTVATGSADLMIEECLSLAPSAAAIKLTWGENPSDLDSHWMGPADQAGTEFHLYYANSVVTVNTSVMTLDVDDVTGFGPEIVSIPSFPLPGTYRYAVNLYSGSGTILSSPARVELNLEGRVVVFSPTEASGDPNQRVWQVFNLLVAADGTTTVQPVQQFTSDLSPAPASATVSARAAVRASPVADSLARKYYAAD